MQIQQINFLTTKPQTTMRTSILMIVVTLLFSCNTNHQNLQVTASTDGNFKMLDATSFNKQLAKESKKLTATEVMRLYYPDEIESEEGNQIITLSEKVLKNGHTKVSLIHDNWLDDSTRGKQLVMELKKQKGHWLVLSLKENWRCWEGRGPTEWGIELCQ